MKLSDKIHQRAKAPLFKKRAKLAYSASVKLHEHNSEFELFFSTEKKDAEICIKELYFETNLADEWLGVVDAFMELAQGKPVEAIDRFPVKELDYFLRDKNSEPAFEAYTQKLYSILSIGETLKETLFPKKSHAPSLERSFASLSYSEQLEYIEELFSYHFYSSDHPYGSLEIDEIEENRFVFRGSVNIDLLELEDFLKKELKLASVEIGLI